MGLFDAVLGLVVYILAQKKYTNSSSSESELEAELEKQEGQEEVSFWLILKGEAQPFTLVLWPQVEDGVVIGI